MSAALILSSVAVVKSAVLHSTVLAAAAKPGSPPPITFVVTALFAIAIFFLGFDLVRRLRRSRFRAEIRENLAAELAERDAATGGTALDDAAQSDTAASEATASARADEPSEPGSGDLPSEKA